MAVGAVNSEIKITKQPTRIIKTKGYSNDDNNES